MDHIARGTFVVNLQPQSFDNAPAEAQFGRMTIDKTITGDLVAETKGQMLSALTSTGGSAGYVAMERVTGVLGGRRGAFTLQHSSTMARGVAKQSITVVPDSATEELAGLAGEFVINIVDRQHFYQFTYRFDGQDAV
jgi:hypothetical protein